MMAGLARMVNRALKRSEAPIVNARRSSGPMHDPRKLANTWRDQFNPLRGLTIARAVQFLEAGKRGEYADLQWLYEHIEEADPTTMALVERYEGGLLSMDYKFELVPEAEAKNGDKVLAEEQKTALREAYEGIDNLREAICFLMLARFRGYSHLEKWVNADGDVTHLECVPQWYWVRDGINGEWQYNKEARSGTRKGEPVPDLKERFLVREKRRPINRIGLVHFVYRNLGLKDWAGFVETYGIPPIFVLGPPQVPPAKEAEYQRVAEAIISDARGYLPNGSDVKSVDAGARAQNPFRDFLGFLKEELVLAGTGGKLTMLAESGSGTLAGGAHQDAWDEIVQGEAAMISEIFQSQFDAAILEERFPGKPRLAYFEMGRGGEEEDLQEFKRKVWLGFLADHSVSDVMANLTSLRELTSQLGLPLNEEYDEPYLPVVDEQGNPVTGDVRRDADGDVVGGASAPAQRTNSQGPDNNAARGDARPTNGVYGNRMPGDPKLVRTAREEFLAAFARDLEPVRKRLESILQIEDGEVLSNRLTAFKSELEVLRRSVLQDPEAARVMEKTLSAALVDGFKAKGASARPPAG